MMKTYLRLLGFASPLSRYAIPYFFSSVLHAIFNTFPYTMIIPIIGTLFSEGYVFEPVYTFPTVAFDAAFLNTALNYCYTAIFGPQYSITHLLGMLAAILILSNVLSNLFRYLGSMTVEVMRTRTLQRMRNEMFERTMGMNVGYFSDQRKGDIMSKITSDVMIVQFCITNTLQVAFREPFLIIGYCVLMVNISCSRSYHRLNCQASASPRTAGPGAYGRHGERYGGVAIGC